MKAPKNSIKFLRLIGTLAICILAYAFPANAQYANFEFNPSTVTVEAGQSFTITLRVTTNQPVSVAEAHLIFDPVVLQLQSMNPVLSSLSAPILSSFDNGVGTVDYGAYTTGVSPNSPIPSSNFDLLELTFIAVTEVSSTSIVHNLSTFPQSVIAFGGQNVLDQANSASITVIPANVAPVNTVPGAQTVSEDVPLSISGISVTDVDGNLASTQLSVTNGTISVSLAGGATISAGSNGSGSLTLSGTESEINAALATLSYQGDLNFNGSDVLTVVSTDSAGPPLTDTDTVAITVTSVNDAPVNTVPEDSNGF